MKGIGTLIRLAKRKLDELRKKQSALENEKASLEQAIKNLQKELEKEIALAAKQPEMGHFYGGFAKRIQLRQQEYRAEIKKIEAAIVQVTELIRDAFSEQKKYEIAQENDRLRNRAEESRKETIEMDEIAGNQFTRKQREER
jgi:flagellar export protein FliJ